MKTYTLKVSTTFIRAKSKFEAKTDREALARLMSEIEDTLIDSGDLDPSEDFSRNVTYSLKRENEIGFVASGCVDVLILKMIGIDD